MDLVERSTCLTHVVHRDVAAGQDLLLSGLVGVPVANQAVVLHTVVLMAHQPVCVHFAFTLTGEQDTGCLTTDLM